MNEAVQQESPDYFIRWQRTMALTRDDAKLAMFSEIVAEGVYGVEREGLEKQTIIDQLDEIGQRFLPREDVQRELADAFSNVIPISPFFIVDPSEILPEDPDPPPKPPPKPPKPPPEEEELEIWDAGDDPGFIPPREWLLGNQFCLEFISSVVAAGGTGKTALRLLQYISLASGRSLTGEHVFRRARVLLICLDDNRREIERRIKAVLDHHDMTRDEIKGWLFCTCPKRKKLAEMRGNKTRIVGALDQLIRKAIIKYKPDLVSFDPFRKSHGLEENNSGDMDYVCDLLAQMADEFRIAVDIPHHVHKGSIEPGDADAGRGSGGVRDAGRLTYTLTFMSREEAKLYGIPVEQRRFYIRLDSAKVNIVAHSTIPTWFKLVGVEIGNATDTYPHGDTVQTVETWHPPETWAGLSEETLNHVLDLISKGTEKGERYSDAAAAKDRAAWRIVQKVCPDKTEGQCKEIIAQWRKTGVLYSETYLDPERRTECKGLFVNGDKRPRTAPPPPVRDPYDEMVELERKQVARPKHWTDRDLTQEEREDIIRRDEREDIARRTTVANK